MNFGKMFLKEIDIERKKMSGFNQLSNLKKHQSFNGYFSSETT
jgi:hypothetical protein